MPDVEAVRLIAQVEIPTAELTILDSRFQFVHRGVGTQDVLLPPGTYLLQYKAGSSVTEVPVVLRPGAGAVTVPAPRLLTRSPAPLAGGAAGTQYGKFAQESSREIHERRGQGGELFIFIRTATKDLDAGRSTESLFDVLLLDAELNVVADLQKSGKRFADGKAIACNLELAPGTYLLRYKTGESEVLEQAVVVSECWQTQVFASSRPFAITSAHLGPNFPEAAVFMALRGTGFDPNDTNTVRSESARIALAGNCSVAPEGRLRDVAAESKQIRASVPLEQVDELLRSKFRNPMLGIYGVHLALLNPQRHWEVLRDVVATLNSLLGSHPDVVALRLLPQLEASTEGCQYDLPPMLRNSWTLVVGESASRGDLVPAGAYAATVANRLWGSAGWLVWRPPTPKPGRLPRSAEHHVAAADADIHRAIALLHKYVLENHRTLGPAGFIRRIMEDGDLTDTQRAILVYATTAVHQGKTFRGVTRATMGMLGRASTYVHDILEQYAWADRLTGGLQPDPSVQEQFIPERLVRALGVPKAALNQAIVALANKVTTGSVAG